MLNNEKIKLMTRLAIYESNEGKEDIKISKYFKSDYIRYNILKSIISVTFGYGLILLLFAIYHMEYLIGEAVTLDYRALGSQILRVYLLLMGVYLTITIVVCTLRYEKSKKHLRSYYQKLKKLKEMYNKKETISERGELYKDDEFIGF